MTSVLLGSVILMWHAIYNGFPFVTSDTGVYVCFAFDFSMLKDRSTFYSLFIALTGLKTLSLAGITPTLWVPVFCQSAIVSFLLLKLYIVIAERSVAFTEILLFFLAVAFGTGASWVSSHIMPDIFTPILFLASLLYTYDNRSGIITRIFYLLFIAIAILVHNSHFLIYPLFTAIFLLVVWIRKHYKIRNRLLHTLMITFCCWIAVCWLNQSKGNGWTLSAGAHVYLMGKLVETGVLKQYLDDNCSTQDLKMCQYKNELPELAYQYIWHESPFNKIGGWDSSASEHNKIIRGVFTSHRYIAMFAKKAFAQTIEQLGLINIPVGIQFFNKGSSPYNNISAFVNGDIPQFATARQQVKKIDNTLIIEIHFWLLILSSVWVSVISRRLHSKPFLLSVYALIILYIVCNAFVTATFANVLDRLQNRVFWLFTATNILVVMQHYFRKYRGL